MNIPIDSLADLIGAENTNSLKARIAMMIGNRIRDDINSFDQYIFYPSDFQDFFDECFEEAKALAKETIVKKLYDNMMNAYQLMEEQK